MNLNGSRNSGLLSWVSSVGSGISGFEEENPPSDPPISGFEEESPPSDPPKSVFGEGDPSPASGWSIFGEGDPSPASGWSVFRLARAVWVGGLVPGLAWTPLEYCTGELF